MACGGAFDGQSGTIEENLVSGWGSAGKVKRAFESAGTTKEGTCEKNDDACVGDHESDVVALPRPPGEGRADEVKAKKNKPQVEPRGSVYVSARHAGTEPGLEKGGRDTNSCESDEEKHSQMERSKCIDCSHHERKRAG